MPVVQLADLRAHLNWPASKGTEDDAELLAIGESATDTIEGYLGRPLRLGSFTETFDAGTDMVSLARVPCPCGTCQPLRSLSVSAVTVGSTTLSASAYSLRRGGIVRLDKAATDDGTVTYAAGYTAGPPWAVMSVKREVEHLWTKSQQSRHSRSAADQAEQSPSPVYLLPYMVQSLLNPHRAGGF